MQLGAVPKEGVRPAPATPASVSSLATSVPPQAMVKREAQEQQTPKVEPVAEKATCTTHRKEWMGLARISVNKRKARLP